jgi:DnaJ-class molecular chaperone
MGEDLEECWSCKGKGFVVKKEGVKPCWCCHGEKVCTRKQNIFAKKRGNWVNVIKNVRNQVNNPITDNDGMNTIILSVKELAFVKYFFKKVCDIFFNQENLEETLEGLDTKYSNLKKHLKRLNIIK